MNITTPAALVIALLFAGMGSVELAAHPGDRCGDHGKIVQVLKDKFKEKPISIGITKSGALIEIFAAENGTWTLLVTRPPVPPAASVTCVVESGHSFETMTPAMPVEYHPPDIAEP